MKRILASIAVVLSLVVLAGCDGCGHDHISHKHGSIDRTLATSPLAVHKEAI